MINSIFQWYDETIKDIYKMKKYKNELFSN